MNQTFVTKIVSACNLYFTIYSTFILKVRVGIHATSIGESMNLMSKSSFIKRRIKRSLQIFVMIFLFIMNEHHTILTFYENSYLRSNQRIWSV